MKKFIDAFNGLKIALGHKSIIIQIVLAVLAIIGGLIIKLDYYEWLAFIICISLVIMCEVLNTAIEYIGNYLNSNYDENIKRIKDLASASVLIASVGALIICIACVLRRI